MVKVLSIINKKGSTLLEALLAVAAFGLFVTAIVGGLVYGRESTLLAGQRQRAARVAEECEEAVRGIRDGGYANLTNGTFGLALVSGHWTLSGSSDTVDIFSRSVTVADAATGEKSITCNVGWNQNRQRPGVLSLVSYLSNWREINIVRRKGMLVYGDGGTTSDAIKYKIYDDNTGVWTAAAATADVDTGTTSKYLRAAKVYASATRNEKVLISRHYNVSGTTNWIYAQVYNGNAGTWGSVQQLSTWSANTFLDAQNFDATYLANGDLMVVYSDFSSTPKYRIWNGTTWGSQLSMQVGQSYPIFITVKARPGTNEVMAVFANQGKRTETQYYNGSSYALASWTLATHATNAVLNTVKFADFDWSPTSLVTGALVYEANTKYLTAKIFTANGTGGGSWSSAVNGPTQPQNAVNVLVRGQKGANEFMTCDKDNKSQPNLTCFEINSFTPTFSPTVNTTLSTVSQAGIQQSMDFMYNLAGTIGLSVFSDNTLTPKYNIYNATAHTFGTSASMSNLTGILDTVRLVTNPISNDMMILLGDANRGVSSAIWDGSTNTFYGTPVGRALVTHGTAGSAITDYWYDFVWDAL